MLLSGSAFTTRLEKVSEIMIARHDRSNGLYGMLKGCFIFLFVYSGVVDFSGF